MSKVFGVSLDVKFTEPFAFTDEWVDAIYSSIESNMAVQSLDMFVREDEQTIGFLIGVQTFLDNSPEAAAEIVDDAIEKAIAVADGGKPSDERTITQSKVLQFA